MENKIRVGISCGFLTDSGGMFPGYKRDYVNEDYITSIIQNGGLPILLPILDDEDDIKQQIDGIDALLLSGGHDIDPVNYNEEPTNKLGDTSLRRDSFDLALIKYARRRQIPILGICRGCQVINVFKGGTIYQDFEYRPKQSIRHWQDHNPAQPSHNITFEKNGLLNKITGMNTWRVNSFHHQAINKLGKDLKIIAQANDGVVEAIVDTQYSCMIGVQFHPEMLSSVDENMNKLFRYFIQQAEGN
ncbi:gamma-glutamyl-gamma-aminobutyrate hydrolase family protein [Ligilactobacillus sp. WILCCON 0076]|uniref:Gamma-glutamyl-gamma-aminobutyrate hydrolase family protein n=1 Tax=Ligilactobacillus ubinensis TaxID=2876789 RepID=A0A9X2JJR2_9LACO|nr:gamma-glutamyl-gamma-aminobutyrate hydrolase family protein [Ligilactobacillus ubinensis]MCP0885777.1 gamma-glutamyl-gamma-aminobutyrate hydrolase family protein [Ligilactobacillus ubinensis]